MLLNAEQWQRLHKTVKETLPWFMGKGLFYGRIGILQEIASSSLHDLYQIRKTEDYGTFAGGFPNPLPLPLILNFANGPRSIDWPFTKGSTQQNEVRERLAGGISNRIETTVRWTRKHDFFGPFEETCSLDYDPVAFGGIIELFAERTAVWSGIGIMCGDDSYIPCSIAF